MTFSAGSGSSRRRATSNRSTSPTASSRSPRDRTSRSSATARPSRSARQRPAANGRAAARDRQANSRLRSPRDAFSQLRPLILPTDVPPWLRTLVQVQQGVWISTIALSTLALGVYGWSVYSQQQWGKAYSQLERLQRNERQLIANKEMMKNQIAQQVDPEALGLAPQKSNEVIFIKPDANPAPPDGAQSGATKPDSQPNELPVNQPLGY